MLGLGIIPFISLLLTLIPLSFILKPIIYYLQDRKGFRKYPPQNPLSGVTKLAYCWEIARPHKTIHSRRLYDQHTSTGQPVIRLGPNWLSFGRSRAARDIYGYTSGARKAAIYDTLGAGGGYHLNNISDKAQHSARRRMMSHFYAPKHIGVWERNWVADSARDLMNQIDALCTAKPASPYETPRPADLKVDIVHWAALFAMETIAKIGLSKDLRCIENGHDRFELEDPDGTKREVNIVASFHGAGRAAAMVIWDSKRFGTWVEVMKRISKRFEVNWKCGNDWGAAVTKLVHERMDRYRNGEILDDLFTPMLEGKGGEEPDIVTRDRIAETGQMVGAGIDGPAVSIITCLYGLIKYPQTFQKLRAELDTVLPAERGVAPWEQVKNLPYLKASIDEALRLSPPVATDLVRRTPSDGLTIDGIRVPGNTDVSISAFTAHRDPELFEDPEVFRPERWIENKGTDQMKEMLASFIPFSAGTRTCIGRNISIIQQTVCIATLVHNYDFALPDKDYELQYEEWFNLWPLKLPVKAWKRENFAQPME